MLSGYEVNCRVLYVYQLLIIGRTIVRRVLRILSVAISYRGTSLTFSTGWQIRRVGRGSLR